MLDWLHGRCFNFLWLFGGGRFSFIGFGLDLKEDIAYLAGVIFVVEYFFDDSFLRGTYLGELFIRLDICYFLKLSDCVSLPHVQFFNLALFDLFAEVREGKPESAKGGYQPPTEGEERSYEVDNFYHVYKVKINKDHRSA